MKLTFDEALEKIGDCRPVSSSDVQAKALNRKVWVASWGLPGCVRESQDICLTKKDAIASACSMAEGEDGVPRGMKHALRKFGRFDSKTELFGHVINTVEQHQLIDLL